MNVTLRNSLEEYHWFAYFSLCIYANFFYINRNKKVLNIYKIESKNMLLKEKKLLLDYICCFE